MAQRLKLEQYTMYYPPETAGKCLEAALIIQRECEIAAHIRSQRDAHYGVRAAPPPSWADVGASGAVQHIPPRGRHVQYQHRQPHIHHQQQQWQVSESTNDVFSSMGHWAGAPPRHPHHQNHQQQQRQMQMQTRSFHQPPPGGDVFNNVGQWSSARPKQSASMPIDLMAPTPLPTFQPYPASLASPTNSMTSSSELAAPEQNSWKTLEALLNQKPSRSPSIESSGEPKWM